MRRGLEQLYQYRQFMNIVYMYKSFSYKRMIEEKKIIIQTLNHVLPIANLLSTNCSKIFFSRKKNSLWIKITIGAEMYAHVQLGLRIRKLLNINYQHKHLLKYYGLYDNPHTHSHTRAHTHKSTEEEKYSCRFVNYKSEVHHLNVHEYTKILLITF